MERGGAEEKKRLRKIMLARRDGMDGELYGAFNRALFQQMKAFDGLWSGRPVYLYISCRREADTRALLGELWSRRIPVAAPRVSGPEMEFFWIFGPSDLAAGYHGILEPAWGCEPAAEKEALVIVPGAAFDRAGYRIGYGGGYYDRFLGREPEHGTLGLAYDFQILDRIPAGEYDRPVEAILTPSSLVKCAAAR